MVVVVLGQLAVLWVVAAVAECKQAVDFLSRLRDTQSQLAQEERVMLRKAATEEIQYLLLSLPSEAAVAVGVLGLAAEAAVAAVGASFPAARGAAEYLDRERPVVAEAPALEEEVAAVPPVLVLPLQEVAA